MEALRRIANIEHNSLILKDLDSFDGKTVEVIILTLSDNTKPVPDKREILKFRGAGNSGCTDTSKNIDEIIYGG
jgi:hypothetical protein